MGGKLAKSKCEGQDFNESPVMESQRQEEGWRNLDKLSTPARTKDFGLSDHSRN